MIAATSAPDISCSIVSERDSDVVIPSSTRRTALCLAISAMRVASGLNNDWEPGRPLRSVRWGAVEPSISRLCFTLQ